MESIDGLNDALTAIGVSLGGPISDILDPGVTGFTGEMQKAAVVVYAKIGALLQQLQDDSLNSVVRVYNRLCVLAGIAGISELNFLTTDTVEQKAAKVVAVLVDIEAGYTGLAGLPCICGASNAVCITYSPTCRINGIVSKMEKRQNEAVALCTRIAAAITMLNAAL